MKIFKWNQIINIGAIILVISMSQLAYADEFKRFSVSAGWLHGSSQGKPQKFFTQTAIAEGTRSKVGEIKGQTIVDNLDISKYPGGTSNPYYELLVSKSNNPNDPNDENYYTSDLMLDLIKEYYPDDYENMLDQVTGIAEINGLSQWESNAGLKVQDIDTLGLMFTYNVNDNISLQMMGGIPPKVKLQGSGSVNAPFSAYALALELEGGVDVHMKNNIEITNLDNIGTAATARAWTPGFQAQYYFGKPGQNKFRPFIGAGFMYAYFNEIEINSRVRSDLIQAGHMIQNIRDGSAGAALEKKESSAIVEIDVDANDAFAPLVSAGFTYDIDSNWFATASVSYAKLDNTATITVNNKNDNSRLFQSKTKIDIDPLLSYVGFGYRF